MFYLFSSESAPVAVLRHGELEKLKTYAKASTFPAWVIRTSEADPRSHDTIARAPIVARAGGLQS